MCFNRLTNARCAQGSAGLSGPVLARASAREEVVRAWCSAKPNSWSVQRANALPVMCGTGKKKSKKKKQKRKPTPQDRLQGSLKLHHSRVGAREEGGGGGGGGEAWPESCSRMIEERPRGGRRKAKARQEKWSRRPVEVSGCIFHLSGPSHIPHSSAGAGESDSLYQMAETNGRWWRRSKVWLRLR